MKIYLHHIHHADAALQERLDWLYSELERLHQQNATVISNQELVYERLNERTESLMATIKELVASVAEVKGKADSIGKLISQLREQITGLTKGNLPPDVQAQVDQAFADAEAAKTELSAAVDNTGTVTPTPAQPIPSPAPNTGATGTP